MPSDTVDQPLTLFFDQTNKVLLATFSGVFTRQITIDLDTAARALAAHHGPFAVILDFTKVTELGIQLRDWPQFRDQPARDPWHAAHHGGAAD